MLLLSPSPFGRRDPVILRQTASVGSSCNLPRPCASPRCKRGIAAVTYVPFPGSLSIVAVPPSSLIRRQVLPSPEYPVPALSGLKPTPQLRGCEYGVRFRSRDNSRNIRLLLLWRQALASDSLRDANGRLLPLRRIYLRWRRSHRTPIFWNHPVVCFSPPTGVGHRRGKAPVRSSVGGRLRTGRGSSSIVWSRSPTAVSKRLQSSPGPLADAEGLRSCSSRNRVLSCDVLSFVSHLLFFFPLLADFAIGLSWLEAG